MFFKNKKFHKYSLGKFERLNECKVSKASNEIMLERFCNGGKIEFPFKQ